jgi:molybdate transport system regulatory protein
MKITGKIWLENGGRVVFGEGREDLLHAVEEYGSLYCAAKRFHMSYRAAWGKIRRTEQELGVKLVETPQGSRGMRLTPEGRKLVEEFHRCQEAIHSFVDGMNYHFNLPDSPSGVK